VFNVTGGELVIILLVALIVLGPDKLPDAIRKVGRVYGELRRMSTGFQSEIRDALDEPMREVRDTMNTMKGGFMGGDDPPPGTRMTAPTNGGPSAPSTASAAEAPPAEPQAAAAAAPATLEELAASPAEPSPTNGSTPAPTPAATPTPAPTEPPAAAAPPAAEPSAVGTPVPAENEHQ
jgi:sec-independent protein translocase protein TatB